MIIVRSLGACLLVAACCVGGAAQAAYRCVDAKGKTVPLASCTPANPLPAEMPGTYTTLPQRPAKTRGPQAQVYESDPHRGVEATSMPSVQGQGAVPVVIQLNAPGGAPTSASLATTGGSTAASAAKTSTARTARTGLASSHTP